MLWSQKLYCKRFGHRIFYLKDVLAVQMCFVKEEAQLLPQKAKIIEIFSLMCPDDITQSVTRNTQMTSKRIHFSEFRTMVFKSLERSLCHRNESIHWLSVAYRCVQVSPWELPVRVSQVEGIWPCLSARCNMSLSRFTLFLKFLRFDDTRTRPAKQQRDKLSLIREIWNSFLSCNRKCYVPGYNWRATCGIRSSLSIPHVGLHPLEI